MLAYVFWHWPRPEADQPAYERDMADFHAALARGGVSGLLGSAVYRTAGAAWLGGAGANYVDWYLLDGSPALDVLNEAAVTGQPKEPHDRVARASGGSAGGLLRLQRGDEAAARGVLAAPGAVWLAKQRGTGYEDFYTRLQSWLDAGGVTLWRRQMVLGPTPEFGLLGADTLPPPPADLVVTRTPFTRVYP